MSVEIQADKLIKLNEVQSIVGISRSQIYELIKHDSFPRPIPLTNTGETGPGSRSARWSHNQIQLWIHSRVQAANDNFPNDKSQPTSPETR